MNFEPGLAGFRRMKRAFAKAPILIATKKVSADECLTLKQGGIGLQC
jgi:hypothetical protein